MSSSMNTDREGLIEDVLTKEQQEKLTPEAVLAMLKEGNRRFVAGDVTIRNHRAQIRKAVLHQYPKAIILSCVDSRVPVEDVFDRGIGDLFVARVAGNFVNTDILGSMEFACNVSGAKLIVVLGHEHCGAIKSAIKNVDMGNITHMLSNLKPAIAASGDFKGEHSAENPEYVHRVTEKNVLLNIERIRKESPILRQMEDSGKIMICGALYDMDNGEIDFLPPSKDQV